MICSPDKISFAADVMVGRLAHWLRVLGYDTLYHPEWQFPQLAAQAQADGRVVLTRSRRLLTENPGLKTFLISSANPKQQLLAVMQKFHLGTDWIFSRCTGCNVLVESVSPAEVATQVPARVLLQTTVFYRCQRCGKVFWQGSHLKRFTEFLRRLSQYQAEELDEE